MLEKDILCNIFLDSIKQKIYGKNISLSEIAQTYDLELFRTSRIDQTYYDNILSSPTVNNLFNNKPNNDLYAPIYISNDDVLFIKRTKYFDQKQLSINESEEAIRALLLTQFNLESFNQAANKKLLSLNNGLDTDYEKFSVYKYLQFLSVNQTNLTYTSCRSSRFNEKQNCQWICTPTQAVDGIL